MRKPTVPAHPNDSPLTPAQLATIGLQLQSYYQLHCGGPTPKRLQMLLDEFQRRSEKILEDKTDR
jgi:hypothetical protein